jgi:pimeloyl-ACP methyl ester carboxylesterase
LKHYLGSGKTTPMTGTAQGSDGTPIAYEVAGEGAAILLIHGFASSRRINWRSTGWIDFLVRAGRKVVAFDCRGHGESGKPHDVRAYDESLMMADAIAVMDAADIAAADIMGYSMGGFIALRLAHRVPLRVRRLILGGVGAKYFNYWESGTDVVADALTAADPAAIADPTARMFRMFAEKGGNDMVALAACMRRDRRIYTCKELAAFRQPTLVVCGENDDLSGPPGEMAKCFPDAKAAVVPKRDHMLTVGDREYKEAVARFLSFKIMF